MENKELEKPKGVDGKIIAAISYFGIIGLIVAFFLSKQNKNELVLFHLKQSAGIQVVYIVFFMCACFIATISTFIFFPLLFIELPVIGIINMVIFIFMVMGILNAFNEKMKPLPIIGKKSDSFFSKYIK